MQPPLPDPDTLFEELLQALPPAAAPLAQKFQATAITLDIYSHVSLELEKKAAAKLKAALLGKG